MRPSASHRALSAALLLLLGIAGAACEREQEGTIRVTVVGESLELVDPAQQAPTPPQAVLLANVAQGLVRFDAQGQIVPGLAERWNVTDDGLSYIFRLASAEWSGGGKVTALQVARVLRRHISAGSKNPLKDALGAVDKILPMTERVIEIRLKAPRPDLLQILAQPEFAVLRGGRGSGPFHLAEQEQAGDELRLARNIPAPDGEEERSEEVALAAAAAPAAVARFVRGDTDLVLGGTFADVPYARAEGVPRGALQFDPASGLFGLVPARNSGLIANEELRRLLSQAIDRDALIAALNVPGLFPRATLLEPGLDGLADPAAPDWTATPLVDRRVAIAAAADRLLAGEEAEEEQPLLRIALPEGPGGDLLLQRLASDWAVLGIRVERSRPGAPADLKLVDLVAPSTSPAWFLRQFRCDATPICVDEAEELLEAARTAPVPAQRAALLADAARLMEQAQLFLPIAAPIRWSLVSRRVQGFAGNRFARHPLTDLGQQLNRERAE